MEQDAVFALYSNLVKQLINYFDEEYGGRRQDELAALIAGAAWDGLILMLRQSFANREEVILDEVGHFVKKGEQWVFLPAASLAEADAINQEPGEAYDYLARQAVFYIREGLDLLDNVPHDITVVSGDLTPEEKLLHAIFGELADNRTLSTELAFFGKRRTRTMRRLKKSTIEGEESATEADEVDLPSHRIELGPTWDKERSLDLEPGDEELPSDLKSEES